VALSRKPDFLATGLIIAMGIATYTLRLAARNTPSGSPRFLALPVLTLPCNRATTASNSMIRSARISVAAALLVAGTSFATAKSRGAASAHGKPFHPGINETTSKPFHPGINETTSRPTAADPYYRLSDSYYGYSDPYRGLLDFYVVPPSSPGYGYGHVRPSGWR
jgi:hypothetical protein